MTEQLIEVRRTLRKEIAEILSVGEKDHVGFYEKNGEIVIRKIE